MGFVHSKLGSNVVATTDDVWALEYRRTFYNWKDWKLIRTEDSLFIWRDSVAIELSDDSAGWIYFFMNGRIGALLQDCIPNYGHDNAERRAEFINKFLQTNLTIPFGAPTKSILSVPRESRSIQSGNWNLSSEKSGTLLMTNRRLSKLKITINENLPGFLYEYCRDPICPYL